MSEAVAQNALLASKDEVLSPTAQLISIVASKHGVSALTQMREMLKMRHGRQSINFSEYYDNRLYDSNLNPEEKTQFVGVRGSTKLNDRLSPRFITSNARGFIRNKVHYNAMIAQLGFTTTETQAVVSLERGFGNIPALRSEDDLEAFLFDKARYPIFVKPQVGSGSVGSALINRIDRSSRELELFNGKRINAREFSDEVFQRYARGLLIQTAVVQHSTLSEVAGNAVGTVRVVTVLQDKEPEILYTMWKIPSPDAMSDNYWQNGSMIAEIENASGRVLQCRRGSGLSMELLENHPVSGKTFKETQIPHWDAVIDVTTRAHKLFTEFGVFGWDIAITENGPLIIECNANPHHMLYQLATGKGLYNDEFAPVFDAVVKRGERTIAARKSAFSKSKQKHFLRIIGVK